MSSKDPGPINSTAGAIPIKNEKGQIAMQKVKVHRYVSGKRPDYAPATSSEEESEEEEFQGPQQKVKQEPDSEDEAPAVSSHPVEFTEEEKMDPRLRRLMETASSSRRSVQAPELLESESEEEERPGRRRDSDSDSDNDELGEDEMIRRRELMKQKTLAKQEEELLRKEEEKASDSEESVSEYEEYTDSDEEEARPRLKPVFVRKTDRITITEKDEEELEKKVEEETKKKASERRAETLKLVEKLIIAEKKGTTGDGTEKDANVPQITDVITDDENEEAEYEAWKLRELKRIKRERDEREEYEREKAEIERLRNMTEEERRQELKLKPKQIINKAEKGKYKFLQKYYHRGVFYLDKEDDVLRRDYSAPTLEDHFDKSVLPKVMQVKNFGRSGRTKYTHLVDQDTTNFESPWQAETSQTLKFHTQQAAGIKPVFERPSTKRRKMD